MFVMFFFTLPGLSHLCKYLRGESTSMFLNYFFSDLFLIAFSQLQLFSDETLTFRDFVF
jgi:hypothetical protein